MTCEAGSADEVDFALVVQVADYGTYGTLTLLSKLRTSVYDRRYLLDEVLGFKLAWCSNKEKVTPIEKNESQNKILSQEKRRPKLFRIIQRITVICCQHTHKSHRASQNVCTA